MLTTSVLSSIFKIEKKQWKSLLINIFIGPYPQNKEDYNISKTMGNLVNNKLKLDDNNLETKYFLNKDTIENYRNIYIERNYCLLTFAFCA